MRRLLAASLLVACSSSAPPPDAAAAPGWTAAAQLPEPVANNAVAAIAGAGGCTLYSALGVDATRSPAGIHRRAFALTEGDAAWTALPEVPGVGRIAASGVALRGRFYVVGGYSVAAGGAETSHAAVDVFDPAAGAWSAAAELPLPIDDAVVVAWRDRWIVVISGWSDTASVATVQVFDADSGAWATATEFPGTPVFGAAGALDGDTLVVVDGVGSGPGGFALIDQAWRGELDPADPTAIAWTSIGPHLGQARYRAASGAAAGQLLFHGGTDEPYNFDGLSYDGDQPAPPLGTTLAYDLATGQFVAGPPAKPSATMDHRGLVGCGDRRFTIGGMVAGPAVTAEVWALQP